MAIRTRVRSLMTIFRATFLASAAKGEDADRANVTKNRLGITKAFMHNGYFKRIEDVVHFYNTRFSGTQFDTTPASRTTRPFAKSTRHRGGNGRGSDRQ